MTSIATSQFPDSFCLAVCLISILFMVTSGGVFFTYSITNLKKNKLLFCNGRKMKERCCLLTKPFSGGSIFMLRVAAAAE